MIIMSQWDRFNPNVFYESGVDEEGVVLVKKGRDKYLLAHSLVINTVRKKTKLEVLPYTKERFEKTVRGEAVKTDFSYESNWFISFMKKKARSVEDISGRYALKRVKKKKKELSLMREAAKISEEALLNAYGKSEEEFKWNLVKEMAKRGAYEAFPSIVANKENSRSPHHSPTKEELGDSNILIDRGARYKNYCSDITDVLYVKGRAAKLYEELQDVFYEIVDRLPSLEKAGDVHSLYEKLYKKKKLPPMPHLIGHGVGIEVHEEPRLYKGVDIPIEGSVIALEPSYYGRSYGLRFERTVYVGKKKAKIL
ncbi:MAG: M24 family metallopeptidase [Methanobacteriota archaeon]|nr:MAG: M24 family metallopeptidase [Euryarchaeota archaeon]